MKRVQLDQSKLLGFKILPPMPKIGGGKVQKENGIKIRSKIGLKVDTKTA